MTDEERPALRRLVVILLLSLFLAMTFWTTWVSRGLYCMATDGGDMRLLAPHTPPTATPSP